jgi:hypothetical protein
MQREREAEQRDGDTQSQRQDGPPRDADSLGAEPLVPDDVEGGRRPGSDRDRHDQRQRTGDRQASEEPSGTRGKK